MRIEDKNRGKEEKKEERKDEKKENEEEEEYNPLKIPADWELARKHALARRVAIEKKNDGLGEMETCPCCGY